jgi:PilZ domain
MVVGRNSFPGMAPDTTNARRFGRLKVELLTSTLGEVVDLSGTGLRIRTPGKPPIKVGQEFDLQVHGLGQAVILPVKCVWIKRLGLFKRELGLQIGEMSDETRSTLTRIAHLAAVKTTVQP